MKKYCVEIIEKGLLLAEFNNFYASIKKMLMEFRKQELLDVLEAFKRRHIALYAKSINLSDNDKLEVEVIMALVEVISEKTQEFSETDDIIV